MQHRFKAKLIGRGPQSAWTFMTVPFDACAAFGARGRVQVCGTINGYAFQNSLMPQGDGTHAMMMKKKLCAGANVKIGDTVDVVLERDLAERTVEIPSELSDVLRAQTKARSVFESLSYSHRKEYADWVGTAKKSETRAARAEKTAERLLAGKSLGA